MVTINVIVYLILMQVWSQVSGQDSNCPRDCTSVNITASNFISGHNYGYTTTGQAAWVTDGVTSGQCASASSIFPAWQAEFKQNRTVSRIRIFWEDQQDDAYVSVGGRICHTPMNSSYIWKPQYTLDCDVPVMWDHLLIFRQPTEDARMLNLSFCEVEIYAVPTTTMPTTSKTLSTTKVTSSPTASSTMSTELWVSMDQRTASSSSTPAPLTSVVMSTTAQASNKMTTSPTPTANSSETSTPPSGEESPGSRFLLLYVIVVGAVAAGVVTVAVVVVVCVRRQKGKRPQAKDAEEAVVPSYEMCVAEPFDHTQYQIIQSHRTPRGWSGEAPTYVNTTITTSCEKINENENPYVNNEYDNDQNVSTGTSCYVNVGSNNQDISEAGESKMYVNTTDFSLYENDLSIRT